MDENGPTADALFETTVNGVPVLTVGDVQGWFEKYNCSAPADLVGTFAGMLNHCAFLNSAWKNATELGAKRRNNASLKRIARIAEALHTLQADLPVIIEEAKAVSAGAPDATIALLESVRLFTPALEKFRPRGRGRQPELWRNIARNLGPTVLQIFKSSSRRRVGFGKPTSAGVDIIRLALEYLGVHKSREAIVDAMRPKRSRIRNSPGK